jgi:uncharacterized membrane protein YphA (DoxX/SURF4 family)
MAAADSSKTKTIGLWALKVIVALPFIAFGAFKLMGMPMLVHEFDLIGLGQGFRIVTGLIEIGGAALVLAPPSSRFGALALLCVSIGAFFAQIIRLHGDVIHTLVLIALTGALAWLTWRPWVSARVAARAALR